MHGGHKKFMYQTQHFLLIRSGFCNNCMDAYTQFHRKGMHCFLFKFNGAYNTALLQTYLCCCLSLSLLKVEAV